MQITQKTIDVLKNFLNVNMNLSIKPGKVLRTISPQRTMFAEAEIDVEFPRDCPIYDLGSFVNALTLFDSSDVEFTDKSAVISNPSGSSITYYYSAPGIVMAPPDKEITLDKEVFNVVFTAADMASIMKVAGALNAPHLWIYSKDGKAILRIGDRKNVTANSFTKDLGATDATLDAVIDVSALKVYPGGYKIGLWSKATAKGPMVVWVLEHDTEKIKYWATANSDSVAK
jgi:hypothetical protein